MPDGDLYWPDNDARWEQASADPGFWPIFLNGLERSLGAVGLLSLWTALTKARRTQPTERNPMDAITMDEAIEWWAAYHGLTRDEADKLVAWDEEEGLQVRVPPHKRAITMDRPRRSRRSDAP